MSSASRGGASSSTLLARTSAPPPWFIEGQTNLRYFIGKEIDGARTRPSTEQRLMPDQVRRQNARKFWQKAKKIVLEHMREWQRRRSGLPVAVVDRSNVKRLDQDTTRAVTLTMDNPLKWASVTGRTVGTWEPYTAEDWQQWAQSSPNQLPPRVVLDIGQDSLVRCVAFALINQVQHCVAVLDATQLQAAQTWILKLQRALDALIATNAAEFNETTGGYQLCQAIKTWLSSRVRLLEFAQEFEPRFSGMEVPALESYSHHLVQMKRTKSMTALVQRLLKEYPDLLSRVDMIVVNNIGDAAFHLDAVTSQEQSWNVHVDPSNLTERTMNELVSVKHLQHEGAKLNALLQMDNPLRWYSLDQGDLIDEVSSVLPEPFDAPDREQRHEPTHWYAHVDAESWLAAYGRQVTGEFAHSPWFMFLHTPSPRSPFRVTSNVFYSGQLLKSPLSKLNATEMLYLFSVIRDSGACKYVARAYYPSVDPPVELSEDELEQTTKIKLAQWLYFARIVPNKVVVLSDSSSESDASSAVGRARTTQALSSSHWYMKMLRYQPGAGIASAKFEGYSIEKFINLHQKFVALGQVGLVPGDVHHSASQVGLSEKLQRWSAIAQVLDRSFKVSSVDVEFVGMLATTSSGSSSAYGDKLSMNNENLLSGTHNALALWPVSHANEFGYAALMMVARAASAHIDSEKPRALLMQHTMITPDMLQAQVLLTQVQHMWPLEYWDRTRRAIADRINEYGQLTRESEQNFRYVLPMASLIVDHSTYLHQALVLHQELYSTSVGAYNAELASNPSRREQQKDRIAELLKKHMKFCLLPNSTKGRDDFDHGSDAAMDIRKVRLLVFDLSDISAPNVFYKGCVEALEQVFPRALRKSGIASNPQSGAYQHSLLVVTVGVSSELKLVSSRATFSEYRLTATLCKAFGVDETRVSGVRVFKYDTWRLQDKVVRTVTGPTTPPGSPPRVAEKTVAIVLDTPTSGILALTPSPPPLTAPVASVVMVSPELDASVNASARKTMEVAANVVPKKPKNTALTKAGQKKQKTLEDKMRRVKEQAKLARDRIQSLRRACELRVLAVPEGAQDDEQYMEAMRAELKRTKELLNRWEQLTNEEESRLEQRLRKAQSKSSVASDEVGDGAPLMEIEKPSVTNVVEGTKALETPIADVQQAVRSAAQETLDEFATPVIVGGTIDVSVATPVAVVTPIARRSPLFLTPPAYKSPSIVGDSTKLSALAETTAPKFTGRDLVQWFLDAALGDLSGYVLLWYVALERDLTLLLNNLDKRVEKVSTKIKGIEVDVGRKQDDEKLRGKLEKHREKKKKFESMRAAVKAQLTTVSKKNREFQLNGQNVEEARKNLRAVTMSQMSIGNAFVGEVSAAMQGVVDRSGVVQRTPNEEELKSITDLLSAKYVELRDIALSKAKSISALADKKQIKTLTDLVGNVNVALGLARDGAPDVTAEKSTIPKYAKYWCRDTYNLAEQIAVGDSGRLPMEPPSTAAMCQRVTEEFRKNVLNNLKPRALRYTHRLKLGVAAAFVTLRSIVVVFLDWIDQSLARKSLANAIATAQQLPTLQTTQRELTSWLGMQQVQYFFSQNALQLNRYMMNRQWGWETDEEFLTMTKSSAAGDKTPLGRDVGDDEELLVSSESASEDEGGESDDVEDQSDGSSGTPIIKHYRKLEEIHHQVWSVDSDLRSAAWVVAWSKYLAGALEVTMNPDGTWDSEAPMDDEDEMDDEDRAFLDDEEGDGDGWFTTGKSAGAAARVEYDDANVIEVDEQFPIYPFDNPKAMQMRAKSDPKIKQLYDAALEELPSDFYNFMHDAFAPAATDAQSNRYVFRPRNGFEHLTLPLWKTFGAVYLKHRKLGRAHEVNNTTTRRDSNNNLIRTDTYKSDIQSVDAGFVNALQKKAATSAQFEEGRKYKLLNDRHNEVVNRDRQELSQEQEIQYKAQLVTANIVQQALNITWNHPPSGGDADDGPYGGGVRVDEVRMSIEESQKSVVENSGADFATIYKNMLDDNALYSELRDIMLDAAVSLFITQPLWDDLKTFMVTHGMASMGKFRKRDSAHAVLSLLPANPSDECKAGALSRFFQYFNATSSETKSLAVRFWQVAIDKRRFDDAIDEALRTRKDWSLEEIQNDTSKRVMAACNKKFEQLLSKFVRDFRESPVVIEVGRNFKAGLGTGSENLRQSQMVRDFVKKRLLVMVKELVSSSMREFVAQSLLVYCCSSQSLESLSQDRPGSVAPDSVAYAARELQTAFPQGAMSDIRWGVDQPQVKVSRNQFVRKPNSSEVRRMQELHRSNPLFGRIRSETLLHLVLLATQHLALLQRSDAMKAQARRLLGALNDQESVQQESSAWASICVLACLRTLKWAGSQSTQQAGVLESSFHWLHVYDEPMEIKAASSAIQWNDVTEVDLLTILHRIVLWSWYAAHAMHFYMVFQTWYRPENTEYDLSHACRGLLERENTTDDDYDDDIESQALGVFALAFPRHLAPTADNSNKLDKFVSKKFGRKRLGPADNFIGASWHDTYSHLKLLYERSNSKRLELDLSLTARDLIESSNALRLDGSDAQQQDDGDLAPMQVAEKLRRKYLRNYQDKLRYSDGALYIDGDTGAPLEYRPVMVKKNRLGEPMYFEKPVDLQAYFYAKSPSVQVNSASSLSSSTSSTPVASTVLVTRPLSATPTVLQPKKRIAPVVLGKRDQRSPPSSDTAKSARVEGESVNSGIIPITSTGTADVPAILQNGLANAAVQTSGGMQLMSEAIVQAVDAALPAVQRDTALLKAFDERHLPENRQSAVSTVVVADRAVVAAVQVTNPATPEKLFSEVDRQRELAKFRLMSSKAYNSLLNNVHNAKRLTSDTIHDLIDAIDNLRTRYGNDSYRVIRCVADANCKDIVWPTLSRDQNYVPMLRGFAEELLQELNIEKPASYDVL